MAGEGRGKKVDLHRHLEGAIRPATALELGKGLGIFPEAFTAEDFSREVLVLKPAPLMEVLGRFDAMRRPIQGFDAVCRISREMVEDALEEGLTALNIRFSPMTLAPAAGIEVGEVFEAVEEGIAQAGASEAGLSIEKLAIVSRGRGLEKAWGLVSALEAGAAQQIHGVDFASDELRHSTGEFREVAEAIDAMGLPLTIHTGEGVGPEAIAETLSMPGLRRISHALSLVDDPRLLQEVRERGLLVEVSPSSNLLTSLVSEPHLHPARQLLEQGVQVAICTDDPTLFGIDLDHEWELVRRHWQVEEGALLQIQAWATDALFC